MVLRHKGCPVASPTDRSGDRVFIGGRPASLWSSGVEGETLQLGDVEPTSETRSYIFLFQKHVHLLIFLSRGPPIAILLVPANWLLARWEPRTKIWRLNSDQKFTDFEFKNKSSIHFPRCLFFVSRFQRISLRFATGLSVRSGVATRWPFVYGGARRT